MPGLFAGAFWGPRSIVTAVEADDALLPVIMERGELFTLTLEVMSNGVPMDCTGYTAQFGVKEKLTDTSYKIGPIAGVFSVGSTGLLSALSFAIPKDTTKAMTPFGGVYSAALYDASGNKLPLTDRGGVSFTLREDILDVT